MVDRRAIPKDVSPLYYSCLSISFLLPSSVLPFVCPGLFIFLPSFVSSSTSLFRLFSPFTKTTWQELRGQKVVLHDRVDSDVADDDPTRAALRTIPARKGKELAFHVSIFLANIVNMRFNLRHTVCHSAPSMSAHPQRENRLGALWIDGLL